MLATSVALRAYSGTLRVRLSNTLLIPSAALQPAPSSTPPDRLVTSTGGCLYSTPLFRRLIGP